MPTPTRHKVFSNCKKTTAGCFFRFISQTVFAITRKTCYAEYRTNLGGAVVFQQQIVGETIRKYRKAAGLSQAELAQKLFDCGNPIQYARIDTAYWQEHFLCYGRLAQ